MAWAPFGLTTRQRTGRVGVSREVVEALVQLAKRRRGEVDDLDGGLDRHGQTFARSQA